MKAKNGIKKGIIAIGSVITGTLVGAVCAVKATGKSIQEIRSLSDKHLALFLMMNHWVKLKQDGINLSSYFEDRGYKKIAIYGMSYAGETLIQELQGTDIEVVYGIDKKADRIISDVQVVSADDLLEDVDVIVVTAIVFFGEIERNLSSKVACPIVSLEDILYEV